MLGAEKLFVWHILRDVVFAYIAVRQDPKLQFRYLTSRPNRSVIIEVSDLDLFFSFFVLLLVMKEAKTVFFVFQ